VAKGTRQFVVVVADLRQDVEAVQGAAGTDQHDNGTAVLQQGNRLRGRGNGDPRNRGVRTRV